ncbi:MAG: hypothetical protein ACRDLO_11390 [Solirubrobacterales bacterium]
MERTTSSIKGLSAACAITLALALAITAIAGGVTHKLEGNVDGDSNGTIRLQVVVKDGKPKKVKKLEYENLDTFCDQDDAVGFETPVGDRSGNAGRNVGPSIEANRSFRWVSYPEDPSRQVNVIGKVKRRGNKVNGKIEVFFNEFPACKAEGDFTATK